jgi:hypothetical protein
MKTLLKDIKHLVIISIIISVLMFIIKTFIFGINDILDYSSCSPMRELYLEEVLYPLIAMLIFFPILFIVMYILLGIFSWLFSFIPISKPMFAVRWFNRLMSKIPPLSKNTEVYLAGSVVGILVVLLIWGLYVQIISDLCS